MNGNYFNQNFPFMTVNLLKTNEKLESYTKKYLSLEERRKDEIKNIQTIFIDNKILNKNSLSYGVLKKIASKKIIEIKENNKNFLLDQSLNKKVKFNILSLNDSLKENTKHRKSRNTGNHQLNSNSNKIISFYSNSSSYHNSSHKNLKQISTFDKSTDKSFKTNQRQVQHSALKSPTHGCYNKTIPDKLVGKQSPSKSEKSFIKLKKKQMKIQDLNKILISNFNLGEANMIKNSRKNLDLSRKLYSSNNRDNDDSIQQDLELPKDFESVNKSFLQFIEKKNKKEARHLTEMIREISHDEYQEFDPGDLNPIRCLKINWNNMNRVIKLRKILKSEGKEDVVNLKNELRQASLKNSKSLMKLGPPNFIKTKFSFNTIKHIKEGTMFGKKHI